LKHLTDMLHIFRSKNQYYVKTVAPNGRTLCISEGFKRKASAINNIRAQMVIFGGDGVFVIDEGVKYFLKRTEKILINNGK